MRAVAVELAVVEESPARQRRHYDGDRPFPRRERRCGPRLVVVLDEAQQPRLVGPVGPQVPPYRRGVLVDEPVVEPLVVAVVETLLLEYSISQ